MAKNPKQQEFVPMGGMNQDDSILAPTKNYAGRNAFAEGDYKYLLNARVGSSNSDNFGDVETIKGTVEVTDYYVRSGGAWIAGTRPTGTEKVIGRYENKEQQRLYYCVCNEGVTDKHSIRFYDRATDAVYELIKWRNFNWSYTTKVSMAMIDNWLAITDRENPPRLMDVDTISDLYNTLGSDFDVSDNFREYHLSFHKWAPVMPPVLKLYYDSATNNNEKFFGKVYQFSYRYVYEGRLKSRWSPISASAQNFYDGMVATAIRVGIPGFMLDAPGVVTPYNYFGHDNTKFYNAVEFIEIAYRESGNDVWRLFKRHDVASSGNTSFDFEGEANYTPIPDDDFYQLFDTVPLYAGVVAAIDNRFVFFDIKEENEPAMTPVVTNIGVASFDRTLTNTYWWNYGSLSSANNAAQYPGLSGADADELGARVRANQNTFKGRGIYKLGIQWIAANGWRSAVYTNDDWIYEIAEETGIVDKIYALQFKLDASFTPPEWAVAYQIMRTNCLNIDYFMFGGVNSFTYLIDDTAAYAETAEVPTNIRDRLRQHFENARTVAGQQYEKYLGTLLNKPLFKSLSSDVRRTTTTTTLADASRIYIDINNWYNSSKKDSAGTQNNQLNQLFYNFREGDRVRFLASTSATPASGDKVVYDVPILEFTGKGIVVEKPAGVLWLPGSSINETDMLIEVYTPKVPGLADFVYHECGEWYPVLNPGTASRALSKSDWTFTDATAITCTTYGDVKVFNKRPFSYGDCNTLDTVYYFNYNATTLDYFALAFTSSMHPDRFRVYDFWEKSTGRQAPAYTDLPVSNFITTKARFGGQIVEESFVNQLNRFKDRDQKVYPSEYGRIRAAVATANAQVESAGAILLAIGEREAFSIYVNRTTLEDLSGRTQVALSDRVLGSYNVLLGSHGTFNPESVSIHRGRVYYWDAINGTWVRYGRDGLTALSTKYKMRNWFKELGRLMIAEYGTADLPMAVSGFDPFHDELITYNNHTNLPATFRDYSTYKGAAFSEDDTRWKYIHSFAPEMFGNMNDLLIGFNAGGVYKHDSSDTNSTFYGTKYDVKIEPVFNNFPRAMKSWQTISIIASHGWSVERLLSEYRGSKTKQQSSINLADFTEMEDGYYASIKMDENTPVVGYPLINGNKMRSKAIRALLKLDPSVTSMSLLHYVLVGEIDSAKNP